MATQSSFYFSEGLVEEQKSFNKWYEGTLDESDIFKDNTQYMRTALVAASALFSDLGDKRKSEYLEKIVFDNTLLQNEVKWII